MLNSSLHFKLFEHVYERLLRKFVVVKDFRLFDYALLGKQNVWSFDLAKEHITLTAFSDLLMVDDVESLC